MFKYQNYIFPSFWLQVELLDEGRVDEGGLLLVVELMPGGVGLVLQGDHLVDFGQHAQHILSLVVGQQDLAQDLYEPGALDSVPPAVVASNGGMSDQKVSMQRSPVGSEAVGEGGRACTCAVGVGGNDVALALSV